MRVAFAASLALTGSGMAFAGTCTVPTSGSVECTGAFTDSISYPNVLDLTLVLGAGGVPTSVIPATAGAFGVDVTSPGSIGISSFADITTEGASGIHASGADSAAIANGGTVSTHVSVADARALDINADGDVKVINAGTVIADSAGVHDVTAIRAESTGSGHTVSVDNQVTGVIKATAAEGFAIGIYGYATAGEISINNDGAVSATSTGGLADGIFASGTHVTVTSGTTGNINANGVDWAAGIEARSYDLTTVSNSGDISAVATANDETRGIYGHAFGIYASGAASGVKVSNSGHVTADGVFATGVMAQGGGPVMVSNTGDIAVGGNPALISYHATGIQASNNYANTPAAVDNSGTITAIGYFAAVGISDVATGEGSIPSVTNSGTITAIAGEPTQGHATGVLISGDAGTDVRNSVGGTISASGAYAYGVDALTFNGDANVVNHGDISVLATGEDGQAFAYGVRAYSKNGNASVTNAGSISVIVHDGVNNGALLSRAPGITAIGVGAGVVNSGRIEAYGAYGSGILAKVSSGDATILNQGSIYASGLTGYGIDARSIDGDVHVINAAAGLIKAHGYFDAGGVLGISTHGDVDIANAGRIVTGDNEAFEAFGLKAFSLYGNATAVNSGIIQTNSFNNAFGIEAGARGDGMVNAGNSGIIEVAAKTASAAGVNAFSVTGASVNVVNSGTITAFAGYDKATGLYTQTVGDIAVNNLGSLTATAAYGNGIGISAKADGDAVISNRGDIDAMASHGLAAGIRGNTWYGNVSIGNRGSIRAYSPDSLVIGMYGLSQEGNVEVGNAGSIDAVSRNYDAIGISGNGMAGDVAVSTSASSAITATAQNGYATGVYGFSTQGDVGIYNGGSVTANGFAMATAIEANSTDHATVTNNGNISAIATANDSTSQIYGESFGITASGGTGGVSVANSGAIDATSSFTAMGISGTTTAGDVSIGNKGSVAATSTYAQADGIFASGVNTEVGSTGKLDATGYDRAAGIEAVGKQVTVANKGHINANVTARSKGQAFGVYASGTDGVTISNAGTITATTTQAGNTVIGVFAKSAGPVQVSNSGTIKASQPKHAVAVSLESAAGSTLTNSGTITTVSTLEGNIAVQGSVADDAIQNFGDLRGALVLDAGNDSLLNGNRGVWDVRNHATDFGAGDDVIHNAAGGTITLAHAAIHLGSSSGIGNAFINDGTIKATGKSLIDMGTGQSATPLAAAFTATAVPSLNALPLTNNGVIDFRDGQPNDVLTVDGDLAGSGQIDLDVSLLKHASDLLYVNGNVMDGAAQTVNVSLDGGLPTTAHTPIGFARVKGTSTANSFKVGHVTDLSPRNFIDLQVKLSHNASADQFYVDLDVAGLNDFGTLAASIAPGATTLINSEIGTWRQRMGVVPLPDGGDHISVAPWARVFGDSGSVDPRHTASNFGQSGNFGYDQSNTGQELGVNVGLQDGFSVGALLGQSTGHQHLNGAGIGSDRIKADTYGIYGTWMSPTGFYVDTSLRRVDFKANLRSIGGEHRASGVGDALNVELGYTAWTSASGVNLIPQFQYTLTSIHDIDTLHGDRFNFALQDSLSWRARLGLAVSKTIHAGDFVWTPYGSVSAIQEMDGQSRYLLADQFSGTTSTRGTSGMVELGLGMQRGRFSLTGGANWTDGGAQQSFLGGQVVLRYAF